MQKSIALCLIDGFADWEFGFLAGAAKKWLDCDVKVVSTIKGPITSIGGVRPSGERLVTEIRTGEYDGIAVIGSDHWTPEAATLVAPVLAGLYHEGRVVGGICGGTLALARAGLLDDVEHTSNSRDLLSGVEGYRGARLYRDAPHAIRSGRIVTAPGSAPGTFAVEFLTALLPERAHDIAGFRALFAREYQMQAA
jgi:putative intracellular protease/amidase